MFCLGLYDLVGVGILVFIGGGVKVFVEGVYFFFF